MSELSFVSSILTVIIVTLIAITLALSIVITPQRHLKFISFLGKYQKTCESGLSFKVPFFTSVDETIYTGRDSEDVELTLKTKDGVTLLLTLKVQYEISSDLKEAFKAVYNIRSIHREIKSVTTNAAITIANGMTVEDIFNTKETITESAENALKKYFADFGVNIHTVLSDEPQLPSIIEDRNNALIAAKRDKEAATDIAEKIRIEKIGAAEADGESVKIRSTKLGEAREEYANKTAIAIKKLVDAGASPDGALSFLNKIGEQDALVTASRNGSTIIFSNSSPETTTKAADTLLALKLQEKEKDKA
jgi:regulator of protease activity HflC (stomatin/prohibitin superfamily)